MKANLKNFLNGELGFNGGCLPGAKMLDTIVSDKTVGVLRDVNPGEEPWFVDVLEDGTAITYYPWFN